jgi:hypothetical protein
VEITWKTENYEPKIPNLDTMRSDATFLADIQKMANAQHHSNKHRNISNIQIPSTSEGDGTISDSYQPQLTVAAVQSELKTTIIMKC